MKSFRYFLSFLQMIKQHCSSVYFKLQRVKLPIALRLLSALFPRHCPVCAKLVPYGTLIHAECQTVLPFISGPTCLRCGKPVSSSAQEYCYDCRTFPKSFQKGLSLFLYNKETRPIMSAFKYHNNRRLADFFIWELFFQKHSQNYFHIYSKRYSHSHSRIYAAIESLGIDAVIPVPIHKNKYKKRGYNQAELLSRRIALIFNLSHYPDMLIRSVDTLPQKQFTPQARLNNLKKAFRFNSRYDNLVQTNASLSVLLVDDIYTSGATMEACTRILLSAGIPNVSVLSICIGMARD